MGAVHGELEVEIPVVGRRRMRTDDERDHAGAITPSGLEAFDQLLDLPDLDILFGVVRLGSTHGGG